MNILVITREFPPYILGGLSYHLKYLYEELNERGHEISVISGRPKSLRRSTSVNQPEDISVDWVEVPIQTGYQSVVHYYLYSKIRNRNINKFDVIITHTEFPFDLGPPTILKLHDCNQSQRQYYRQDLPPSAKIADSILNPIRKRVANRSLNKADHIIFNSKLTRKAWNSTHSTNTQSSVIYNGVDTDIFHPTEGINEDYYLFVGDSIRKGIHKVQSFAAEAEYPVYAVGQSIPSDPNINSVGRLDQDILAKYYSGAIATVHPAEFEAFGNVILESLACGTPVIVSEHCGVAEILTDSCGVITEKPQHGVKKIGRTSMRECTQLASQYSWDQVAARTENVIQSVLEKH